MHTFPFSVAAVLILAFNSSATAGQGWALKASAKPVKITGKLLDDKNVSGAASMADGRLLLACDDLKSAVQTGRLALDKGEINMDDKPFPLFEDANKEPDFESVAADPEHHCYYTCGSLSLRRKSGDPAPDRQWLFRIETDAKTGAPMAAKVAKVSLKEAMSADAFLREHMDKSAADLGIDIEGLAFKDGRLWFGLRSPNVNGWAFVVAAPAADLMAKKPVVFQRFELPLGEDLGIREIAPIKDGFLLITGPTGAKEEKPVASAPKPEEKEVVAKAAPAQPAAEETVAKAVPAKETVAKAAPAPTPKVETPAKDAFALYFWPGDTSKPVAIGELQRPDKGKGKPEGLLVVSESTDKLGVLVLSDDADNGAPLLYDISRPARHEGPVKRNDK